MELVSKKLFLIKFTFVSIFLLSVSFIHAQNIPQGINYQAVVRDANGNAKTNEQVPLQFTIYQSSATGTIIYQERQVVSTNSMGQCSHVIGTGNPVPPYNSTSFSLIDWGADSTFLKVELNANTSFTGTFTPMGPTTKFQSVPYALYAQTTHLKIPTVQRFTSGSGTYNTPAGVLYIKIRMVGGGGGGGGGNVASAGGNTTFGTSFLTAGGGSQGTDNAGLGGNGGTVTVNAPAIVLVNSSSSGCTGGSGVAGGQSPTGGHGGNSPFGGAGRGGGNSSYNGAVAYANSGSGGGGASGGPGWGGCSGGGSGGYIEAVIYSPNATYSYSVGTAGSGGTGNSSFGFGGNGAAGIIIIEEYYQ